MPTVKATKIVRIAAEGEEARVAAAEKKLSILQQRTGHTLALEQLESEVALRKLLLEQLDTELEQAQIDLARQRKKIENEWAAHTARVTDEIEQNELLIREATQMLLEQHANRVKGLEARAAILDEEQKRIAEVERELQERETQLSVREEANKNRELELTNLKSDAVENAKRIETYAQAVEERVKIWRRNEATLEAERNKLQIAQADLKRREEKLEAHHGELLLKNEELRKRTLAVKDLEAALSRAESSVVSESQRLAEVKVKQTEEALKLRRDHSEIQLAQERMARKYEDMLRLETRNRQESERLTQVERSLKEQAQKLTAKIQEVEGKSGHSRFG